MEEKRRLRREAWTVEDKEACIHKLASWPDAEGVFEGFGEDALVEVFECAEVGL